MRQPLSLLVIITAVCMLASCDPVGSDEYHVVNNSSSSIVVRSGDSSHTDTILIIPAGQTQTAIIESGIGQGQGPDQQTITSRSLYDVMKDTLSCKKDIKQLTNWQIEKIRKGNTLRNWTSVTSFTVTDADF